MNNPRDPSRRDFLAVSAVGLVALARGSDNPGRPEQSPPDEQLLYVGTYTENGRTDGIHLVRMNPHSGKLRLVQSVNAGANPSFLTLHPNGRVLYAVNEVDNYVGKSSGGVGAFSIASDTGALTRRNQQPSEGGGPCFVSVDRSGRVVLVANYDGGSVALLPIEADGSIAPAPQVVKHTGKGPIADRQEAAHAHCILADPSNRFALSADLGADRVFVYRLDLDGKSLRHVEGGDAVMRPGAGPRHIAFHPTLPLVFVANELDSTVATLRFDARAWQTVAARRALDGSGQMDRNELSGRHPHRAVRSHALRVESRAQQYRRVFCVGLGSARARAGGFDRRRLAAQFHARSNREMGARRQSEVRLGCRVLARPGKRAADADARAHRAGESSLSEIPAACAGDELTGAE